MNNISFPLPVNTYPIQSLSDSEEFDNLAREVYQLFPFRPIPFDTLKPFFEKLLQPNSKNFQRDEILELCIELLTDTVDQDYDSLIDTHLQLAIFLSSLENPEIQEILLDALCRCLEEEPLWMQASVFEMIINQNPSLISTCQTKLEGLIKIKKNIMIDQGSPLVRISSEELFDLNSKYTRFFEEAGAQFVIIHPLIIQTLIKGFQEFSQQNLSLVLMIDERLEIRVPLSQNK